MNAVFDLELRSPETGQKRYTTVHAETADDARAFVEQSEEHAVNSTLDIPDKEYWENPPGTRDDDPHGLVDLGRWDAYDPTWREHAKDLSYEEAKRDNQRRIDDYMGRMSVEDNGKVDKVNRLGPRTTARLLTHMQQEPYEILSIEQIAQSEITRQQLARAFQDEIAKVDLVKDPEAWTRVIEGIRSRGWPTAAVTAQVHGLGALSTDDGSVPIVWGTNTMKTSLHTALTNNPDTQDNFDDVSGTEITGTGYTTLGFTLTSPASTYDTASDQTRLDAVDASWTTSTLSATDAVVFKSTGTTSSSRIYGSVDFGATVTTTAGTFQITWDATGIIIRDYT